MFIQQFFLMKIKNLMLIVILITAITLIYFTGCVSQKTEYESTNEKLYKTQVEDVNNNGIIDTIIYEFMPIAYDDQTTMKRYIHERYFYNFSDINESFVSKYEQNTTYGAAYYLSSEVFDDLKNNLEAFTYSKDISEKNALLQLGMYKPATNEYRFCYDPVYCRKVCSTPKCELGKESFGYLFLRDVRDLAVSTETLHNDTDNLEVMIDEYKTKNQYTKEELQLLLNKIVLISEDAADINSNPCLSTHGGGLKVSSPIEYNFSYLQNMIDMIVDNVIVEVQNESTQGITYNYSIPINYVRYTVIIEIIYENKGMYDKIEITEKPVAYVDDLTILSDNTIIQNSNIIWKISDARTKMFPTYISYTFTYDKPLGDNIIKNIYSPSMIVEASSSSYISTSEIENSELALTMLLIVNTISSSLRFLGTFFAIGLAAGLAAIILRYVVLCFETAWELMVGIISRKDLKEIFIDIMGSANPNYSQYLGLGVVLLVTGAVLTYGQSAVFFGSVSELMDYLLAQPIGMASSFLITLSIISIYFGAEEYVKLRIFGTSSMSKDIKHRNIKNLDYLNDQIKTINKLLSKVSSFRIDVTNEQEILLSIPVKRITQLTKDVDDQAQGRILLEHAINRAEYCIKLLNQKMETITNNWKKWESVITKRLESKGEVYADDMLEMPKEWREVSLELFLMLHPEQNLIIEKRTLKPATIIHGKSKGISVSKLPFHASEFKMTGEVDKYTLNKGNRYMVGVLANRIIKYSRLLDTPASHVKINSVFVGNVNKKGRKSAILFPGNRIIVGTFTEHSFFEIIKKVF